MGYTPTMVLLIGKMMINQCWLVVSNMTFIFHFIWDVILPIDELHHFSRWLKPPPTSHNPKELSMGCPWKLSESKTPISKA